MNPWIFLWEFEGPTNNKDYAEGIIIRIKLISNVPEWDLYPLS